MTGAALLAKSLRSATTRQKFVQIKIRQQIAALIACVRQQVCVPCNLAARLLQARFQQRFHEAREETFLRCSDRRPFDGFSRGERG